MLRVCVFVSGAHLDEEITDEAFRAALNRGSWTTQSEQKKVRECERECEREFDTQTERWRDTHTDTDTQTQTHRQTDRQTDRHTHLQKRRWQSTGP